MSPLCALVFLNVCLMNPAFEAGQVTRGGALSGEFRYTGSRVRITASDVLVTPRLSGLARACQDGRCVHYHRFCGAADGRAFCEFQITVRGTGRYQRVRVDAPTDAGVASASAGLGYLAEGGGRVTAVPLSKMTRTSREPEPPICDVPGGCR